MAYSPCNHRNTLGVFGHQRRTEPPSIIDIGKAHGAQSIECPTAALAFWITRYLPSRYSPNRPSRRVHSLRAMSGEEKAPSCARRVPTGMSSGAISRGVPLASELDRGGALA